jgi:hypothetical protein
MNYLRVTWCGAVLWLIFLFGLNRVGVEIRPTELCLVFAASVVAASILAPAVGSANVVRMCVACVLVMLVAKVCLGHQILGIGLTTALLDCVAIAVTVLIARQLSLAVNDFQTGLLEICILNDVQGPMSYRERQKDFYQEIRRARRFNRTASIVKVRWDASQATPIAAYLMKELHRKLATRYFESKAAAVLATQLKDADILATCDDGFLILLPERNAREAGVTAELLSESLRLELGARPTVGFAAFPDEEVTLTGLLSRVEEMIVAQQEEDSPSDTTSSDDDDLLPTQTHASATCPR